MYLGRYRKLQKFSCSALTFEKGFRKFVFFFTISVTTEMTNKHV